MSAPPAKGHSCDSTESGHERAVSATIPFTPPGTLLFSLDLHSSRLVSLIGDTISTLGISEQACSLHGALIRAHVHEDDRYRIETLLEESLSQGTPFVATYRWTRPDSGHVSFLHCRALARTDVGTFDGVLTDITESAATLQGRGLAGVTLGNNLALMGVQGVTLDLALNFQTIEASNDASFLSLGHTEYVDEAVKVGGSLLSCFSTTDSRQRIQALFDGALASSSGRANIEWEGYGATIHVFPSTATPEGYLLYVTPLAEKQALEREVSALRDRIEALEKCGDAVPDLLNISQEIVGYAALIQKHAAESPLLRHITDSLSSAVRALSAKAREVVEPFRKEPESAQGPRPLIRSRKATVDPVVVFSADTKSVRHMQAALLSDSGISSVGAPLGQDALKATLTDAPSTKVLIVDVPGKAYPVTGTIRALRKLFPDLYIVCLVPGSPNSYPELQRAGAILVLPKPITPHELVRVIRGLLHLSAAMSQSDEMEVTTPRAAQRAEVANEDS